MSVLELNQWVGIGTALLQAATALLLVLYFMRIPALSFAENLLGKWGIGIGFLMAAFVTAMSLVYSEYFGIVPCGLCWLQRIFIYPQVVMLGVAFFIKDTRAALYSIWFSVFGAAVSLYQHYMQMTGSHNLPCPASGVGDCGKRYIFELGYITFPLVAFSAFAFLIVLMLFVLRRKSA